jgi:hypothetical protein
MRKTILMSTVLAVAGLMGATQFALADSECSPADDKAGAAQMKKTEDSERAGKLKEAYEAASKLANACLPAGGYQRNKAMLQRVGLQLGQQEEKQGRLAAAFDWYRGSGNGAEAGRVKMKQVKASPHDRQLVSDAIDYFKGGDDARVTELRQLAAKNADLELANEEKAFAGRKESFDELGKAKDWFYLVGESAAKKARERAEQRGDTLAKEDTFRHLENAKHYFSIAEAKSKDAALKDKALRLAQAREKAGEITEAQRFYSLAGASAKGNELQERAEAQHKKSEDKRQKQFKKGQGDLEKELGL